jgi:hypothetical protein
MHTYNERGIARRKKRVRKGLVATFYDDNKQAVWPTWVVGASFYGLCCLRNRVSSSSTAHEGGCWQSVLRVYNTCNIVYHQLSAKRRRGDGVQSVCARATTQCIIYQSARLARSLHLGGWCAAYNTVYWHQ